MERYAIYEGSRSAHCCFEATVVDTTRPRSYDAVCECFDMEDAGRVCGALNAADALGPSGAHKGGLRAEEGTGEAKWQRNK